MTAPEHSPLPWRIYQHNLTHHILGADGLPVIGSAPFPGGRGARTNKVVASYSANARLIVAAVNTRVDYAPLEMKYAELLEAARRVVNLHWPEGGRRDWLDALEAAIAKAEQA